MVTAVNRATVRLRHNEMDYFTFGTGSRPFVMLPDLPRWVSVDERLPKQDELVLGRYKNGDMAVGHFSSNQRTPRNFLEKSNMWDDFFVGKRSDIAYWMPLPEEPKEET